MTHDRENREGARAGSASSPTWDPDPYLQFDDERSRPFHDLLARVGATDPRHVVDAGCGPGHLTSVLATRWPRARVSAFDSSPDMVAAARSRGIDAFLEDIAAWTPGGDVDVVIAHSVLHWVPDHGELVGRWLVLLPEGGWLALQVPGNFADASHSLVREVAHDSRWRHLLELRHDRVVRDPAGYAEALARQAHVDVWESTYMHRLVGADPVLRWLAGSTLRPVRDVLTSEAYAEFTAELAPRLRAAYPRRPDGGTWFPFRRIFAVARVTRTAPLTQAAANNSQDL